MAGETDVGGGSSGGSSIVSAPAVVVSTKKQKPPVVNIKPDKAKKKKRKKQKKRKIPRKTNAVVQFDTHRRVYKIPRHDEPGRIWYSVAEYQSIFTRDSLILALQKGGVFRESDDYTFRGLERHLSKKRIKSRRAAAVAAVLEAQRDTPVKDWLTDTTARSDRIAEGYVEAAFEALEIALQRGQKDADACQEVDDDVSGYYLDADDDIWETASDNSSEAADSTALLQGYGTLEQDSQAPHRPPEAQMTPPIAPEQQSVQELLQILQTTPLTSQHSQRKLKGEDDNDDNDDDDSSYSPTSVVQELETLADDDETYLSMASAGVSLGSIPECSVYQEPTEFTVQRTPSRHLRKTRSARRSDIAVDLRSTQESVLLAEARAELAKVKLELAAEKEKTRKKKKEFSGVSQIEDTQVDAVKKQPVKAKSEIAVTKSSKKEITVPSKAKSTKEITVTKPSTTKSSKEITVTKPLKKTKSTKEITVTKPVKKTKSTKSLAKTKSKKQVKKSTEAVAETALELAPESTTATEIIVVQQAKEEVNPETTTVANDNDTMVTNDTKKTTKTKNLTKSNSIKQLAVDGSTQEFTVCSPPIDATATPTVVNSTKKTTTPSLDKENLVADAMRNKDLAVDPCVLKKNKKKKKKKKLQVDDCVLPKRKQISSSAASVGIPPPVDDDNLSFATAPALRSKPLLMRSETNVAESNSVIGIPEAAKSRNKKGGLLSRMFGGRKKKKSSTSNSKPKRGLFGFGKRRN